MHRFGGIMILSLCEPSQAAVILDTCEAAKELGKNNLAKYPPLILNGYSA